MTEFRITQFRPGTTVVVIWSLLAIVLFVLTAVIFMVIAGSSEGTIEFMAADIIGIVLCSIVILAAHEWLRGWAMTVFGAKPVFGAVMIARVFPALYCTVEGFRFTRKQYSIIALAPILVLSAIGSLVLQFTSWFPLIFALSFNVSGAIGDLWMTGLVLTKPSGTLFEDMKDGVRMHEPMVDACTT